MEGSQALGLRQGSGEGRDAPHVVPELTDPEHAYDQFLVGAMEESLPLIKPHLAKATAGPFPHAGEVAKPDSSDLITLLRE